MVRCMEQADPRPADSCAIVLARAVTGAPAVPALGLMQKRRPHMAGTLMQMLQ